MIFHPNLIASGFLLLAGFSNLSLAVFILLKSKRRQSDICFSLFCFGFALCSIFMGGGASGVSGISSFSVRALIVSAVPLPFLFLLFSNSFPEGKMRFSAKAFFLLSLPSSVLVAFSLTDWLVEVRVLENGALWVQPGFLEYLSLLHFLVYFSAAGALLYRRFRIAGGTEKKRYKYLFFGAFLTAATGIVLNIILPVLFGISFLVYFGPLATLFLAGFTAYAILKQRLFDISIIIKKTTAYSIVTAGLTIVYVIMILGLERFLRLAFGYQFLLGGILAALFIAVSYQPFRERLQTFVDNLFFRHTIEYQKVIKEITHIINSVTDLHTLFRLIDRTIVRVMCIKNAAVLLLEEKDGHYQVEKTNGLPETVKGLRLSFDDPLVVYLQEKNDAVVREETRGLLRGEPATPAEKENLIKVQAELERLAAAVAVPSFLKGKLVGILTLGVKLSGELYSPDDLELLLTLASEAGIAIENAKLYRDITETRDYLNNLIQKSDDAIVTLDAAGNVLSYNEGAGKIFGYEAAEVIGRKPHGAPANEFSETIARVLRGETVRSLETGSRHKTGANIPILLTASPIRNSEGEITGIFVIMKDITELKKVDRLKAEFLSVVSHELRTPLTPIKGYLSLLFNGSLGEMDAKQSEALKVILNQSDHLQNLIDTVIDISRLEANKPLELENEPLFIADIIEQSVAALSPAFKTKDILVAVAPEDGRLAVLGDRKKLLRVMDNLLGNSLKFVPAGGKVEIAVRDIGGAVEVRVSDTGIGIAQEHLGKIFDKFYQVDSSYTRATGGIGMGLTIAREIVRAHGGEIRAESEGLGRGTKIIFTIPVSRS